MKKLLYVFGLLTIIIAKAQENKDITYIRTHAILAVQEMEIYKIPASITLAQGLLETGGGQSRLANQANNHFGIKCKGTNEWSLDKPRIYHNDDKKGECFRKYSSTEESYRDHSKFLALRPYYKSLFILNPKDYKAWAKELKKSGYATDPKYSSKLISIIEKYNLDQFDTIGTKEVYAKLYALYNNQDNILLAKNAKNPVETKKHQKNDEVIVTKNSDVGELTTSKEIITKNTKTIIYETRPQNPSLRIKRHKNNIPYIIAQAGETITSISKIYNIMPSAIAHYNEIEMGTKLRDGQIIFFGNKKSKGSDYSYKVQPGDDMYSISQKFGVKINKLYKYNRMDAGTQPKIGQLINLKTKIRS